MDKYIKTSAMLFLAGVALTSLASFRSSSFIEIFMRSEKVEVVIKGDGQLVKNNRKKARYEWYSHDSMNDQELLKLIAVNKLESGVSIECYRYNMSCYEVTTHGMLEYMPTKSRINLLGGLFLIVIALPIGLLTLVKKEEK